MIAARYRLQKALSTTVVDRATADPPNVDDCPSASAADDHRHHADDDGGDDDDRPLTVELQG